jgi:hypothetical protein
MREAPTDEIKSSEGAFFHAFVLQMESTCETRKNALIYFVKIREICLSFLPESR